MRRIALVLTIAAITLGATLARAEDDPWPLAGPFHRIHVIDLDGEIDSMQRAYMTRRIAAAQEDGADCIVLRIESPGGSVLEAKQIGEALLALPGSIHSVAWVPREALSAAAWISLACDEIVLASHATFGDCQPILMSPGGAPIPAGEKLETALRAWFRAWADKKGHPVLLAQAMVSESIEIVKVRERDGDRTWYVDGAAFSGDDPDAVIVPEVGLRRSEVVRVGAPISHKGHLLTLTGREALDLGFVDRRLGADGTPESEKELLEALSAPGAAITHVSMSVGERAGRWLIGLTGVLAAIVAFGATMFLWQGSVLAGIIAASALTVLLLISGLAEHLHGFPLFLIALGLVLLVVEVYLIPGFGLPGILGIAALATGAVLLATGASLPDREVAITRDIVVRYGLQFVATTLLSIAVLLIAARTMPGRLGGGRGGLRPLEAVPATADAPLVGPVAGERGTALTALRPAGRGRFGGAIVDVVSDGAFVESDRPLVVLRREGHVVVVREAGEPRL